MMGHGQVVRQWPAKADPVQSDQAVANGVVGDAAGPSDLPVSQTLPTQPEDLLDRRMETRLFGMDASPG